MVEDAIAGGAKSIVRGGPVTEGPLANGAFSAPTLLEVTESRLPIVQQEVFGPVLTMQVFDTEIEMAKTETAILAGGCFWGMQDLIRALPGVVATRVGYSGGDVPNATYRNHGSHAEAIEVVFEPTTLSYRDLLEVFFKIHDPTTRNRQGNDTGTSYRSGIYYLSDEQRRVAEETIADVNASGLWPGPVVTEVRPAGPFWEAEPEHQDYLLRHPGGYTCHFPRPDWKLPRRANARTA